MKLILHISLESDDSRQTLTKSEAEFNRKIFNEFKHEIRSIELTLQSKTDSFK